MSKKYKEFLILAKGLNKLGITPLLMGSLGLERATGENFQARDIDIHVPGDEKGGDVPADKRIYQSEAIHTFMTREGYHLLDIHEHEYQKEEFSVELGIMDSLESFAGILVSELDLVEDEGASYFLPTPEQFLAFYQTLLQDLYRNESKKAKDLVKISYLEKLIKHK